MKVCTRCEKEKEFVEFCKNKSSKDGKCVACKECMYKAAKVYKRNNRDKMNSYLRQWYKDNPEKGYKYYVNQRENNPNFKEQHKIRNQRYSEKKPYINREKWGRYRAQKLQACPAWADKEELKLVYKNCPKDYEVDHIIPLQGKNVSGLHVPWNLQYLTRSENASKGNKVENYG